MPDFLTGSPVTGVVPTQSSSVTSLPDWYTNYAKDIIDQQALVAQRPYTPYQGPQVAGFTPDQQTAFGQTRTASTASQPGFAAAGALAAGAPSAAAPLQAAGVNYLNQSTNPLGLNAAAPFLSGASGTSTSNINDYMNPYTSDVVDRLGVLAGRNLSENILPQIQDQFTSAGQGTGGSRQGEYIGRALRDTQESTLAAQSAALQSGYSGALTASAADKARLAGLAGTAGSLGAAQQGALQTAGTGIAGIGLNEGNLALNAAQTTGNLAAADQTSRLQGAGALQASGGMQQALDQQNESTAYADFLRQQGYDQKQIDAMTGTVGALTSTLPKQTQSSGTVPATAYNPSTAATLASLGLDAAAIAKIFSGGG